MRLLVMKMKAAENSRLLGKPFTQCNSFNFYLKMQYAESKTFTDVFFENGIEETISDNNNN